MVNKTPSMQRAKITKITLSVEYPDGTKDEINYDLNSTNINSIFWDDQAVSDILIPFYNKAESTMTKREFIARFGSEAEEIIKNEKDPFKVKGEIIDKLWKHPNSKGFLRAMIAKTTDCTPR